jgi:molecular chaperone DnaJ
MNNENFYQTLGVEENATQEDIKKKYRQLAKENHPDVGGDEEKFKKISTAYDTLGDNQKRQQYDQQKKDPFGSSGGFNDYFNNMFNRRPSGGGARHVHTSNITVNISTLNSYKGGKHTLSYRRQTACEPCNGTGGDKKVCNGCGGSGVMTKQFSNGTFFQVIQVACETCHGKGSSITNPCFLCTGSGTKVEMKTLDISLPHGIDNGQFLRLTGMGDFKNGIYGDLVVRIELITQDGFSKIGTHLVYDAFMTLEDLISGNFTIPHPDGELSIKLPKNMDTSIPLRVKSKGFRLESVGDLIVNQYVKYKRD